LKTLILTILILISSQIYAGDLIILDRYHLEKSGNSTTNSGVEHEQGNKKKVEKRKKMVVRGEETVIDTQARPRNRNIDNYVIKKSKHQIKNTEDSPFLEYQF